MLVVIPALVPAPTGAEVPPVSVWGDSPGAVGGPAEVPGAQFTTFRIDSMAAYIRYLFKMKLGVILPEGDDFWFFLGYDDYYSHVRVVEVTESQLMPGAWNVEDIFEGGARVSPTAYFDGAVWYPEVTFNASAPTSTLHMVDEGGIGVGLWSPPFSVGGGFYDYYFPLTEAGPDNVIYLLGQARDTANGSYVFVAFGGSDGTIWHEALVFADTAVFGQGYENSQLLYHDGLLAAAVGGYRTANFTSDPLLVVYKTSTDEGQTWSDAVWLDQAVVPDMPGTMPGIEGHWSNSFFDGLIDNDGDLHFLCAVVDSGCFINAGYVHGLYDVHQDNGLWTAARVTDGTYYVNADSTWDPRSFLGGDSHVHAPSLAWHPDGIIYATWADIGYVDPVDSSFTFDIWYTWSVDEGNTWHNPSRVTETPEWNESFPKLLPTTTERHAYVLTMYEWADGPMDMVQFWPIWDAPDSVSVGPAITKLTATPNPLADAARVSFSLASPGVVEAGVYNAKGELVETLVRGSVPAGDHSLVWNAGDAPPGAYVCWVKAGEQTASTRIVLVR